MAQEKGEYRPAIRLIPPADEQVVEILSDGHQRFEEQRLSRAERTRLIEMRRKQEEKKRKEKEKAKARSQNKMTVDLPEALRKNLEVIANKERVTISQVATFFLFEAVEKYEQGEISFWGCKHRSGSPRYDWILVHPKDTERMQKVESRKSQKL